MAKKNEILNEINDITNLFDKNINLKESLSFGDEIDDTDTSISIEDDAVSSEAKSKIDSKPIEEKSNGYELINKMRKMALEGMCSLADSVEDPQYDILKKVWQMLDKTTSEANKPELEKEPIKKEPVQSQPMPQHESVKRTIKESMDEPDPSYTHYLVRNSDGKILDGHDYTDMDKESIKYYCRMDIEDMGLSPKEVKLITKRYLINKGINPQDWKNWSN